MAEVIIPHFDLPFRITLNHHAAVVQQDTVEDVTNCVNAILRTTRGTRYYVPLFGIDDPTFQIAPIDLVAIENQVAESEPRAHMILDQLIETVAAYVEDRIQVGVDVVNE